jgi:hypothetical protein
MKKWMYSLAATVIAASSAAPVAFAAATNNQTANSAGTSAAISLNNTLLTTPGTITKNNTVYVPAWYTMQVLKSLGIESTWDGHAWKLNTADSSVQVNRVSNLPANTTEQNANSITESAPIYVNGQLVMSIPSLFAIDPASHKTTAYVQIDGLNNLLNALNVSQSFDGHTWRWLTGDAKALSVAFTNTQNAPHSQFTGTLDETIQITATDPKAAEANGIPEKMDINMKMQGSTAIKDGAHSAYITITTSIPDKSASTASPSVPLTVQEYMEGNRVWMNLGDKWQELTGSEQLIQSLQSQNPMNNFSFNALQQIHASVNGNVTTYTATINTGSMADTFSTLFGGLSQDIQMDGSSTADNPQPAISSSQFQTILDVILQQMKGTMTITTGQVDGQLRITEDEATIDMNLPLSTLTSLAAASGTNSNINGNQTGDTNGSPSSDISGMSLHETMTANYAYDDVPVSPPTGLDTSTMPTTGQN